MFIKTDPDQNGSFKKTDNGLPSNTIGEFTLKDRHYLILLLSEESQVNCTREPEEEILPEVSRFEIEGQHCAIVKSQPNPLNSKFSLVDILSERELQIATLVALGRVNKQIARQLHISEWTVATYIRRIFYKLGVESRAAMVYRCASLIQELQAFE